MNEYTGEIKDLEDVLKLPKKEQKKYIPIPDDQIEAVKGMNRKERRSWAKKQRSKR